MRNFLMFTLFVCLLIIVQFSTARSLDELVDRYMDALGGYEKLKKLQTLRLSGRLLVHGQEMRFTSRLEKGNAYRVEIVADGVTYFEEREGRVMKRFFPGMETVVSEESDPASQASFFYDLFMNIPFLNWRKREGSFIRDGVELVGGEKCYKIDHTNTKGEKASYFISRRSYLIKKTVQSKWINGQYRQFTQFYDNYQRTPEGFLFPCLITNDQGEMTVEAIVVNHAEES